MGNIISKEEVEKMQRETHDLLIKGISRDYKVMDIEPIAEKMVHGELIEAYVATLHAESDFFYNGGSYTDAEYKEIEKAQQYCEHLIARKVLQYAGWEEKSVKKFFSKKK